MSKDKEHDGMTTFAAVLAAADKAQSVISGKVEQVAQALLALASSMSTPDQFDAGCVNAESQRKARLTEIAADKALTKAERKAMTKLPSAWSNAKSVLLRGWMDYGLIPNDHETFSSFKNAKIEATKANKPESISKKDKDVADSITETMEKGSITTALYGELITRIAKLPTEVQEEIALELDSIVSTFEDKLSTTQTDSEALEEAQLQRAQA